MTVFEFMRQKPRTEEYEWRVSDGWILGYYFYSAYVFLYMKHFDDDTFDVITVPDVCFNAKEWSFFRRGL